MRLKYQLFLTLVLFSLVLILLLAAINSWTFNRGFSKYVIENEKQRLSSTVETLQGVYTEHGSWDWVQSQPDLFRDIVPPPRLPPRADRLRANSRSERSGPPRGSRNDRPGGLTLMGANKQVLLGEKKSASAWVTLPIVVNEEEVGYLGFPEPRRVPGGLAELFIQQQLRNYAYATAAIVLLSALLAIALASRVVRPILSVKKAVQTISGGNYTHTVESNRIDEIGDLAKDINHLSNTLKHNQRARHQWMAEISHELRTPVAVLQGELEAMQDGVVSLNREGIDSLHAESVRLGLLINDLHDLSMSDLGALNYRMESVDVAGILQQRLHISNALIVQADLDISVHAPEQPIYVRGDPQRLAQLFDNLLQNSVRYTDAGGKIVVHLSVDSNDCVLNWNDSSPGVSDEHLPHLFNALYRTEDSRNRDTGGSGLGLTIVSKIVDAHSGTVNAYHSNMNGLGVQIRLPV